MASTTTARTTTASAVGLLRDQGMRMTPQRLAIVDEIMTTAGYVIPTNVIERVQARVPGVSPSTVYRTLERLESTGVLAHVHLESGLGYHRLDEVPHAHLTCARCGSDLELSRPALRSLERLVERQHGFRPDFTHYAISGRCAACRMAEDDPDA
ncbi:MAG TPA: Fur family transcriptional regulator [Actinomycetes bacterium]|jgi:Fur family ferric uptake transcriptional regulator|nr:Fur family transcriptional regulator [Actinomycetes bacterium]